MKIKEFMVTYAAGILTGTAIAVISIGSEKVMKALDSKEIYDDDELEMSFGLGKLMGKLEILSEAKPDEYKDSETFKAYFAKRESPISSDNTSKAKDLEPTKE